MSLDIVKINAETLSRRNIKSTLATDSIELVGWHIQGFSYQLLQSLSDQCIKIIKP